MAKNKKKIFTLEEIVTSLGKKYTSRRDSYWDQYVSIHCPNVKKVVLKNGTALGYEVDGTEIEFVNKKPGRKSNLKEDKDNILSTLLSNEDEVSYTGNKLINLFGITKKTLDCIDETTFSKEEIESLNKKKDEIYVTQTFLAHQKSQLTYTFLQRDHEKDLTIERAIFVRTPAGTKTFNKLTDWHGDNGVLVEEFKEYRIKVLQSEYNNAGVGPKNKSKERIETKIKGLKSNVYKILKEDKTEQKEFKFYIRTILVAKYNIKLEEAAQFSFYLGYTIINNSFKYATNFSSRDVNKFRREINEHVIKKFKEYCIKELGDKYNEFNVNYIINHVIKI